MPQPHRRPPPTILFLSRRLQLPLYLGPIVAQVIFVWYLVIELTVQTASHITFLISALAIAAVDRILPPGRPHSVRVPAAGSEHGAH